MILVNTGLGNGLLPDGTKPLPKPMLTYHQCGPLAIIPGQYLFEYSRYQSVVLEISHLRSDNHISQDQWVKANGIIMLDSRLTKLWPGQPLDHLKNSFEVCFMTWILYIFTVILGCCWLSHRWVRIDSHKGFLLSGILDTSHSHYFIIKLTKLQSTVSWSEFRYPYTYPTFLQQT